MRDKEGRKGRGGGPRNKREKSSSISSGKGGTREWNKVWEGGPSSKGKRRN